MNVSDHVFLCKQTPDKLGGEIKVVRQTLAASHRTNSKQNRNKQYGWMRKVFAYILQRVLICNGFV